MSDRIVSLDRPGAFANTQVAIKTFISSMQHGMRYGAIIRAGARGFRRNAWVLVGFSVLYFIAISLVSLLAAKVDDGLLGASPQLLLLIPYGLLLFLQVVLHLVGNIALIHGALMAARGQTFKFGQLFAVSGEIFNLLGYSVFAAMAILLGLLALGIPGIYLAVAYWFAAFFLVDRRVAFLEAMALSRALVTAQWFDLAAFLLVLGAISVSGVMACGVGLFATVPLAVCIGASAYLELTAAQG
ncbi:MAG: hypothetical protein VKK98_00425 [Cyanobacteriota bacterium]|nr:hypothetical protein [Cyanobacteriota bacterium]